MTERPYIFIFPDGSRKICMTSERQSYRWPLMGRGLAEYSHAKASAVPPIDFIEFRLTLLTFGRADCLIYVPVGLSDSDVLGLILNSG